MIAIVESTKLAAEFTEDFEELWSKGDVEKSGFVEPNPVRVGGINVRAWFTPGFGEAFRGGSRSASGARSGECGSAPRC